MMTGLSAVNAEIEFWMLGVAVPMITLFGLVGNITIVVLFIMNKICKSSTLSGLIIGLAVLDSIFLVLCTFVFSLPILSSFYHDWVYPHVLPTLLPFTSIALTGSLYGTIALSVERYLHITNSVHQDKGAVFGYVLPVLAFSICFNFPKFFEFSTEFDFLEEREEYLPVLKATHFRESGEYSFYVLGANTVFMGILPFTCLIILNVVIALQLRTKLELQRNNDASIAIIVSSLVTLQLLSHFPRMLLNIYELIMTFSSSSLSLSYSWLVDLSHLLLVIAASSNVLIITAQDARFRRLLLNQLKKSLLLYRSEPHRSDERERSLENGSSLFRQYDENTNLM